MKKQIRRLIPALGVAVAVPAVALAAGNSVKISAPHTAHVGVAFSYTATVTSKNKAVVSAFINTAVKCPKKYKGELALQKSASPPSGPPVVNKVKPGTHTLGYSVRPNSKGAHYICVYLHKGKKTLASAHSKYVTS